eukprot:g2567.t1
MLRKRQLNLHLGAEIDCSGIDLSKPMSDETNSFLFDSLMEHKVVALRNTRLGTAAFAEFARQVQEFSLRGTEIPDPDVLLYESKKRGRGIPSPIESSYIPEHQGVLGIGPWPSKTGAIGNSVWHADSEYFHYASWFTLLRMAKLPLYQEGEQKGEVIPCGDTLWADTTLMFDQLSDEDKKQLRGKRCVYDWKVAYPHVKLKAAKTGDWSRVEALNALYPPVERPVVQAHPITGELALAADPAYVSHIVGLSPEESKTILERTTRLCDRPEYQLRLPWRSEGDI